jgi:hypothetical protein
MAACYRGDIQAPWPQPRSAPLPPPTRRGVVRLALSRETSASINSKLLVLDLCSDCKSLLPDPTAERANVTEVGGIRYTGPPNR